MATGGHAGGSPRLLVTMLQVTEGCWWLRGQGSKGGGGPWLLMAMASGGQAVGSPRLLLAMLEVAQGYRWLWLVVAILLGGQGVGGDGYWWLCCR